jgi:hypothetical protein
MMLDDSSMVNDDDVNNRSRSRGIGISKIIFT